MGTTSLKARAYEQIRSSIQYCIYPPGSIVNEEKLSEDLQISRTPIRDAISRLEQDGLCTILPKKGIQVRPLTLEDVVKVFETRLVFEPYTILNYANHVPNEEYLKYYEFNLSGDYRALPEWYSMDHAMHHLSIARSENPFFASVYQTLEVQNHRIRFICGKDKSDRLEEARQEHLLFLGACLEAEWEEAARQCRIHLKKSKEAALSLFLKNIYQPVQEQGAQ